MQTPIYKQGGAVLIVSLIMLLLMTLIAVTSIKSTILEEKMAGNYKDRNTAFQAAEASLRGAEDYLRTTSVLPTFNGSTTGLYPPTSTGISRWKSVNWSNSSDVVSYSGLLYGVASTPKYIIEELPTVTGGVAEAGAAVDKKYYRITTQAVGGMDTSIVQLQSTYKR